MSDTFIQLNTDGSGKKLDTRTESTNSEHRQVFVVGDPSTNAGVAPVDGTAGLKVDLGTDNDITGTVTANIGTVATLSTAAKQDTGNTSLSSIDGKITAVNTGAVTVASSALPSGAATAAKQPALGTAGTASADVITVQGKTSMTPLLVDNSANTQPVSGTVTAISGTAANLKAEVTGATSGSGTSTGAIRVELPTNGTGVIATVGAVTALTNALPAGTNAIGKLAANSGVDIGDVDVTTVGTITPGTGATSLGKAEDAVHNSGDVGIFGLAVANEAQSTLAADGDYIGHATDTKGNTFAVGNIANDGVDAGNPVKIGGLAKTALPTAVADGDRVNALYSKTGMAVAIGQLREQIGNQQTTITSSTSETTIVTADATYLLDLYGLILTNISSTGTKITIKDATSGTTRFVFWLPANDTRGFTVSVDSGHKQATVNNNWTATCGTSVASIEITAMFSKRL